MMTLAQNIENLPEGWASCPLRELVRTTIGGDWGLPPEQADGVSSVEASVIRGTEFRNWDRSQDATAARRAISSSKLASRQLEEGDIVLEVSGGGPQQPVGRTVLIDRNLIQRSPVPLTCSNFCRRLQLSDNVKPAFVWWFLRWLYSDGEFDRFQTQTTNLRNLNVNEFLDGITIRVAPLTEQKRIVAKVEQVLARVNAARERLAKVPKILKRFRQSVLAAACSGRLTADWRDGNGAAAPSHRLRSLLARRRAQYDTRRYVEPVSPDANSPVTVPDEWELVSIDQITSIITSGSRAWSKYYGRGTGTFIMAQNVRPIRLDLDYRQAVDPPLEDRDRARSQVEPGDVLVTIVGANTGDVCSVDRPLPEHYVCQSVALMRPIDARFAPYLNLYLNSPQHGRGEFDRYIYGEGRPHISFDQLKMTAVALPPLSEQREIVRRVGALFKLADTIERRIVSATQRTDKTTQAVLAKAFRGELVPTEAELGEAEGRDYETAEALLERIRRERVASQPSTTRSPRRPRAARQAPATADPKTNGRAPSASHDAAKEVKRTSKAAKAVVEPARSEELDFDEMLAHVREVFADGNERDRDQAIRDIASALGYARVSPNIRETASSLIRAAVRRGILAKENGQYALLARSGANYTRDHLIDSLLSSINGIWTDRPEAIRATARHLGHRRASPAFQQSMKSAINGALRRQIVESNGPQIRKARG